MAIVVFDLDMTIVDSSHRHASKPDGSIDLAHWFENCHRVVDDSLLPLARAVRVFYEGPNEVIFCTARCMQQADYDWLAARSNILPHHALYSREGYFVPPGHPEYENSYHGFIGDGRGDGEIKLQQIQAHIKARGFRNFAEAEVIIFEDNLKTLDLFKQHRAIGINAVNVNKRMAA